MDSVPLPLLTVPGRAEAGPAPPSAVLTKALLASVFRMKARLETAEDGKLRIYYEMPVS